MCLYALIKMSMFVNFSVLKLQVSWNISLNFLKLVVGWLVVM